MIGDKINEINLEYIKNQLKTNILGRKILYFQSLASTNKKACDMLQKGGAEKGLVLIAEEQTAGRGRQGKGWYSPCGTGLYFTILLEPCVVSQKYYLITVISCLSVVKSLEDINVYPQIKWPNDLLLEGKKICGILSQLQSGKNDEKYFVVGIGLNLNQREFPSDLKEATSVYNLTEKKVDRTELLKKILENIEYYYLELKKGKEDKLLSSWKNKLAWFNKQVIVKDRTNQWQGRLAGISKRGELILEMNTGEKKKFWAGNLSLRKQSKRGGINDFNN